MPLVPRGQDDGRAAGRQAHAVGRDRAFQELHGVVDRQRRRHRAAGAVDVEVDLLGAVLVLQVQQLLNRDVGQVIGDGRVAAGLRRAAQEDDAVFQQQVAQRHLPLAGVVAVALDLRVKRAEGRRCIVKHGNGDSSTCAASKSLDCPGFDAGLAGYSRTATLSSHRLRRSSAWRLVRRLGGRVLHLAGHGLLLDGGHGLVGWPGRAARPRTRRCPGSGRAPCARSSRRPGRRCRSSFSSRARTRRGDSSFWSAMRSISSLMSSSSTSIFSTSAIFCRTKCSLSARRGAAQDVLLQASAARPRISPRTCRLPAFP